MHCIMTYTFLHFYVTIVSYYRFNNSQSPKLLSCFCCCCCCSVMNLTKMHEGFPCGRHFTGCTLYQVASLASTCLKFKKGAKDHKHPASYVPNVCQKGRSLLVDHNQRCAIYLSWKTGETLICKIRRKTKKKTED